MVGVAGVVDRPRLYEVLDASFVRVCVVQGPSGSGKTTLLRSWATRRGGELSLTWISLGEGIADRQAFWQHVAASAARIGELSAESVARIDQQLGAAVDPVRIASTLLADAGAVVLIFDAYEHLGDAMQQVDEDLARLVRAAPELRIMITTRAATALSDLDVADGIVRVITLAELALTSDEVGALLTGQTGISDDALARSVASITRGFALTVRAVVLALSQLGRIPHVDSMEWHDVVAVKLESLLPDPVAVQFVTDTSVPPYVDLSLAHELSGNEDAGRLLGMLERNGFGRWIPYARHRPVFQYVETIRDTFRARASDDDNRFRWSCTVTARWLLENGEVDQALAYAVEGGDYALADRIFVPLVITKPNSYVTTQFLAVLRSVPESALVEHPMLAFGLGLALMANPLLRAEAPRAFRIAIESPAQPAYVEPDLDTFSLAAMRAIARRLSLMFRASADACMDTLRLLDGMDPDLVTRFGDHIGTILRQMSYSLLLGGRVTDAIAAIDRSVALCTSQVTRNYSIVYGACMSALAGDVVRARTLLSLIDWEAWPPEMRHTSMNGLGLVAEAYVRLDALDFAGASDIIRETDPYMQTIEYWPLVTTASVFVRQGLGQAQAEAQRVTRVLSAAVAPPAVGDNIATEQLHAAVAFTWMAGGDYRAAGRLLDGQATDSPYLAAARVAWLLGAGRDREALEQALAALELADHTLRTRTHTQTVGAVAALRQGDPELARAWLDDAAVTWETYGPRVHVAMLAPRDRRTLWEFARDDGSSSLLRYLDTPLTGSRSSAPAGVRLTPREAVVLRALAEHGSVREIAGALVVSPHTVKTQLQGLYRKLGVTSRLAAVAVARELGLLDVGSADRDAD